MDEGGRRKEGFLGLPQKTKGEKTRARARANYRNFLAFASGGRVRGAIRAHKGQQIPYNG